MATQNERDEHQSQKDSVFDLPEFFSSFFSSLFNNALACLHSGLHYSAMPFKIIKIHRTLT